MGTSSKREAYGNHGHSVSSYIVATIVSIIPTTVNEYGSAIRIYGYMYDNRFCLHMLCWINPMHNMCVAFRDT